MDEYISKEFVLSCVDNFSSKTGMPIAAQYFYDCFRECEVADVHIGGLKRKEKNMPNENYPNLRSCPFCGGKSVNCTKQYDGRIYRYRIQCDNAGCACRTPWLCYQEDAVEVWNRRTENDD